MSEYEVIDTDVLVIGGGGVGCRAAIEAHDQGADVLMIVKGRLGHSGCTLNVGTSAAVGPWGAAEDSHDISMRDLLAHGGYLGNQDMVKVLVEESPSHILELESWGIDFVRNDDESIEITRSAAHTYPRNLAFKPAAPSRHDYGSPPGIALMEVLIGQMKIRDISVMDDVMLIDLLMADGRAVGATALDCRANKLVVFRAKSVILATGSYSQVFSQTTVSPHETGDGQAAAFRAGAELIDMENTQFVPTSVGFRQGTILLNGKGERFLEKYGIKSLVGVTKEEVCYAVGKEIWDGGGTANGAILIDMTGVFRDDSLALSLLPAIEEDLRKSGSVYPGFKGEALRPTEGLFETAPLAHTTTGGVRANVKCESSVPGLYSAGAVTGGVYGHARPEGYTSMITLVFGRRAGLFAAQSAKEAGEPTLDSEAVRASLDRATALIEKSAGLRPRDVRAQIQASMMKHAWVIKDEKGLKKGLQEIEEIKEVLRVTALNSTLKVRPRDGFEWATAIEVRNLLLTSELTLRGSIERRESRGAFFRDDYPETDNRNWTRNIIYKQVDGRLVMDTVAVDLKYCGPDSEPIERRAG